MNILVLFGDVAFISKASTLKGIVDSAKKDNNNVFLFTCEGFLYHSLEAYSKGEYEIFKIPDLTKYDGIIVDFNSIQNEETRSYLITELRKLKVPVVSFEYPIKNANVITYEYIDAYKELLKHLIVDHGYKDIHLLTGPIENNHSLIRLNLYKEILSEYGLSYSDNTIHYGDFNYKSGKTVASLYIKENRKIPEAFVCANDYMAIGLIEEFKANGIHCPKDITVVGIDNTKQGKLMSPTITTIDLNEYESGVTAYQHILKGLNKEVVPKNTVISGAIHYKQSCGCEDHTFIKPNNEFINITIQMDQSLDLIKAVSIQLMTIKTTHEFERTIAPLIAMLGIEFFYFCQFGSMESYYKSLELKAVGEEYEDPMTWPNAWCPLAYEQGAWKTYPSFNKKDLLPPDSVKANGVYYITLPIHKDNTVVGYTVMGNFNEELSGRILQHLALAFDKAISTIMMNDLTSTMLARVNNKWKYDELTKIYNRSGLYDSVSKLIEEASVDTGLLVVFFDLDGLKQINDKYGHKAGDDFIKKMANLLAANANDNDIYARFGGDEFIMVCECNEIEYIERYEEIKDSIQNEITVSIGYTYEKKMNIKTFSGLLEAADINMYIDKQNRKNKSK